ncbi:MAG: hypothetical protein LUO79_08965 [Methanomassiliicoccales archaeon]|nr:hypothetical protein [Methanomassiliicoccales archaeon]
MRGVTEDISKRNMEGVFQDRRDAALQLADLLSEYSGSNSVVLALPPEGVEIGVEMARLLLLPIDALVVREIVSPDDPSMVFGAMAPDDVMATDETMADMTNLPEDVYRRALDTAKQAVAWRVDQYRGPGTGPELNGRTAILVSDGMANPVRMLAAVKYAKRKGATRVVVAVPTATARALEALRERADDVRCINVHHKGEFSVERAYRTKGGATESDAIVAFRIAMSR